MTRKDALELRKQPAFYGQMRKIEDVLWDGGVQASAIQTAKAALLAEWPELGWECRQELTGLLKGQVRIREKHIYNPCTNCGAKREDAK